MLVRLPAFSADTNDLALPSLPNWLRLYGLRTAIGYRDNVLLAPNPRGSAFVGAGGEFMVVRLPGSGADTEFFISADRTHFFANDVPDSENTVSAVGKVSVKKELLTAVLNASYLFQDQVLDVSATDPEFNTIRARVHDMGVKPAVRYDLPLRWFVEMEPAGRRQEFASPLDDLWEASVKTTVGRSYGRASRLGFAAQAAERFYDEKEQLTREGVTIPDTSLRMHRFTTDAYIDHYWDTGRVWRTQCRIGYWYNDDNGSGYFDYHRWFALLQLRYKRARWELRAQIRFDDFIYSHQTVSAANSDRRRENEINWNARAEWKLTKATSVFVQYDQIVSHSSRSEDEYDSQTVSAGAQWEF